VRWVAGAARRGRRAIPCREPWQPDRLVYIYLGLTKRAAGMASQYRIERDRGTKESARQFALLREKWPLAFPVKHKDIRPLAVGVAHEIAATMGWSHPYTLGVLHLWKMAPVYCQAVVRHDQRIALDGAPVEAVDAGAKDLATKRLAELAARKAVTKAPKTTAPAAMTPTPAPAPATETRPETPDQLRARVRAALLRRSA
jgi:sRNA-binding protein